VVSGRKTDLVGTCGRGEGKKKIPSLLKLIYVSKRKKIIRKTDIFKEKHFFMV